MYWNAAVCDLKDTGKDGYVDCGLCLRQSELLGMYVTDGQQVLVLNASLTASTPPLHYPIVGNNYIIIFHPILQVGQISLLFTVGHLDLFSQR